MTSPNTIQIPLSGPALRAALGPGFQFAAASEPVLREATRRR